MADFNKAFIKTMEHEGGYVDDIADKGGKTYKGISRVHHPEWAGWELIDDENIEQTNYTILDGMVKLFYKTNYWNRLQGDNIPSVCQSIAEELFDVGVNMGTHTAVKFLQQGLNLLNRNQKDYGDIPTDGKLGEATLSTMKVHTKKEKGNCSMLLKVMNALQAEKYIKIMRSNPSQERFARGWMKRT